MKYASHAFLTIQIAVFFACAVRFVSADESGVSPAPPAKPTIILPIVPILDESQVPEEDHPVPLPPKPDRSPKPVSTLSEDTWYVIESSIPLIILHSPSGHVAVQPDEGPVKVRGKFADGTGKTETRTFSSKHLYFVNAVKAGQIELLVIPVGLQSEQDILRQTLTVMGLSPNPPPGPGPSPEPGPVPIPEPDPPVPVTSFRVIFVRESGSTLNAQQSSVPAAAEIRAYLNRKTTPENGLPGWREYDPQQSTTNEQPNMKALWTAVKPNIQTVPVMVVEVNGRATVMPFPANVADAMQTLKKAGGE